MRAPDESRICQYSDSRTRQICGAPLFGRGRHRWCRLHATAIRDSQRKAAAAGWQKAFRERHRGKKGTYNATERGVDYVCGLLKAQKVVKVDRSLRHSLRDSFRLVLGGARLDEWEESLQTVSLGHDFHAFFWKTRKRRDWSGATPEECLASTYVGCFLWHRSPQLTELFSKCQCEANGLTDKLLAWIFIKHAFICGWSGGPAIVIRLLPLIHMAKCKREIYYIEFRDLERNKVRRTIFWFPKDNLKDRRASNLWRRLDNLMEGDAEASSYSESSWLRNCQEILAELRHRNEG